MNGEEEMLLEVRDEVPSEKVENKAIYAIAVETGEGACLVHVLADNIQNAVEKVKNFNFPNKVCEDNIRNIEVVAKTCDMQSLLII